MTLSRWGRGTPCAAGTGRGRTAPVRSRAAGRDPRGPDRPAPARRPLIAAFPASPPARPARRAPARSTAWRGEPGAVRRPRPLRSLRVLVAEDNRVNQLVIRRLLEQLGHTVVLCGDGRAAVAAVEAERPDLVLMDVQMPKMDGFEATAAIREREAARPGARTAAHRRADRVRDEGRPRALPGRGHGRLPVQADPGATSSRPSWRAWPRRRRWVRRRRACPRSSSSGCAPRPPRSPLSGAPRASARPRDDRGTPGVLMNPRLRLQVTDARPS